MYYNQLVQCLYIYTYTCKHCDDSNIEDNNNATTRVSGRSRSQSEVSC